MKEFICFETGDNLRTNQLRIGCWQLANFEINKLESSHSHFSTTTILFCSTLQLAFDLKFEPPCSQSQSFYKQLFCQFPCAKKFHTQTVSAEKLSYEIKCWWNWHRSLKSWAKFFHFFRNQVHSSIGHQGRRAEGMSRDHQEDTLVVQLNLRLLSNSKITSNTLYFFQHVNNCPFPYSAISVFL